MPINRRVELVVKISKYCNLRCNYCYEFSQLGDKTRMSFDNIKNLFDNIRSSVESLAIDEIFFFWHGGEPFMVPIDFYERLGKIQKEVFGGTVKYYNVPQTNLTILTERHIEFIKSRSFFNYLGVSFDVYGDQRVDTDGQLCNEKIVDNLQKLIDHEIPFSAISVLARNTLPHIKQIYRFFDALNIEHRILPYYMTADSDQAQRHRLGHDEIVEAYKELFHEWLSSERSTAVAPIMDYVRFAVLHLSKVRENRFDRFDRFASECVFIVDINGDVYGMPAVYDADYLYGNLFRTQFSEILKSGARRRSIMLSQQRMQRFCHQCPYFGACPGEFVANATYEQQKLLEARGCLVRDVIEHIVEVFERTHLKNFVLKTQKAEAAGSPALALLS